MLVTPRLYTLINDMNKYSKLLNPIVFADDSNLFYSHCGIKISFEVVNKESRNILRMIGSKQIISKTNYVFFHKNTKKEYIPLKLP